MALKMELTKTTRTVIFLFLTSAIAFLQMAYQITLPGPYYDEAYHGVYASWLFMGKQVLWGRPFAYSVLGVPILGSLGYYAGPFESYLSLFSMSLLGINIIALRIPPIFFAVATLPFVFFFVNELLGEISAFVTTLLFAVQPSLILWSRVGFYPFSIVVFFICSSLYMFQRWLSTRKRSSLAIGAFLLGLGFETFITFAWYTVALVMTVLLLRINTHIKKHHIFIFTAGFLIGVGPYLLPWLSGDNISFFIQYALVSHAGVNNLNYIDNLLVRLDQLRILIDGSGFGFLGGVHSNPLAIGVLTVSLLGTVVLAFLLRRKQPKVARGHLFLVAMFTLIVIQIPVTINSLESYQLMPLIPFSLMIIGAFVGTVWNLGTAERRRIPRRTTRRRITRKPPNPTAFRWLRLLLVILLLSSLFLDVSTTVAYQRDLAQSGGLGSWSAAIYDAAAYLMSKNCSYVLAVDWGLSWGLLIASGGRLNVRDIFWVDGDAFRYVVNSYVQTVSSSQLCFVSWRNIGTSFNRLDLLRTIVASWNRSLTLDRTFYQRDGTPVIDIYQIT
jgi:4-amino-4-deoxy-L-arabinose transferase-like glycosyltransferase